MNMMTQRLMMNQHGCQTARMKRHDKHIALTILLGVQKLKMLKHPGDLVAVMKSSM